MNILLGFAPVAEQHWHTPFFLSVNRRITWAWAGAFAALVTAHAVAVFAPVVPWWLDIVVTIFVLAAVLRFLAWYPEHARKKAGFPVVRQ